MNAAVPQRAYKAKEIKGIGWQVVGPDGAVLPEVYASPVSAGKAAGQRNRMLKRSAGKQQRPCLCCGDKFLSEGAHNRLCDPCRRKAEDGGVPYGFATTKRSRR